ncbi:uncharacterized protein LOC124500572 [Dermatophagoides farinae]|nr:uncharacterized protein LOC124500572 [Dermatophagoides farinae]KAH7639177.1 hypothetical protein HUG17_3210 [Dermatophagoides farinae]
MSELSWSQQFLTRNGPQLLANWEKYYIRLIVFIDYVPLLGPLYNAGHALNLLWLIWRGSFFPNRRQLLRHRTLNNENINDEFNDNVGDDDYDDDDENDLLKNREKYRQVRERGLTAIVTALIDIFTICLALAVIAFICDCLLRIQTFAFVRQLCILFIMINILALTIGAKIIAGQAVINVTRQLEDVNHVGISMVKSAHITATAIERIVETTETTTNIFVRTCQYIWSRIVFYTIKTITFPRRSWNWFITRIRSLFRQWIANIKMFIKRNLTWMAMMNLFTLGFSGWLMGVIKRRRLRQHSE